MHITVIQSLSGNTERSGWKRGKGAHSNPQPRSCENDDGTKNSLTFKWLKADVWKAKYIRIRVIFYKLNRNLSI